jgi:hypothetical protein
MLKSSNSFRLPASSNWLVHDCSLRSFLVRARLWALAEVTGTAISGRHRPGNLPRQCHDEVMPVTHQEWTMLFGISYCSTELNGALR